MFVNTQEKGKVNIAKSDVQVCKQQTSKTKGQYQYGRLCALLLFSARKKILYTKVIR